MPSKYAHLRYRLVSTLEDMNRIIRLGEESSFYILTKKDLQEGARPNYSRCSVLVDNEKTIEFTTKYVQDYTDKDGKTTYKTAQPNGNRYYVCTWIYDKTGEDSLKVLPNTVYKMSQAAYKIPEINDLLTQYEVGPKKGKTIESAKPILGHKYDTFEGQIYGYDLNSAYSSVLIDKFIDSNNFRLDDKVGENEVGFLFTTDLTMITEVGKPAEIVFPLIDSPYKDFVSKWYKIKKTSTGKEKAEAKQILNIMVGLWQNHNAFARAYVVNSCNNRIKKILDAHKEDIVYWNTDSVYSKVPLPELELGEEIGQWKLEYQGLFRTKQMNFQKVDKGETSYRGWIKARFPKDFNILTDKLPQTPLRYYFNWETFQIEESEGYIAFTQEQNNVEAL